MMKIKKYLLIISLVLFFGSSFFALAQTSTSNPIYWIDNSAFTSSGIADRGKRAVLSAVANQSGSIVTPFAWQTISNQSQLLSNVTNQFSKIPAGSVVVLRYTGHGATYGITPGNNVLISRADYLNHAYSEAVKNDLHVIMIDEDCYGQRLCAPITQQQMEDGRISILTGSKGPNAKTDGESGANYYARIIENAAQIDTNNDGKVTYGEWEKWAKDKGELGAVGHIGDPDAVLFNRADVAPYETQYCIHVKPGQDEGDGFGPMFGNEDVYAPDTQLNILGETIAQITAKGLTPKQEGTDGKEGNYAARKNQMGHLRANFPKYEKKTHQGDEDELDEAKGPSSNYQTARNLAMQGKDDKTVKILWSSGKFDNSLTAQQLMDSVRNGDHSYKAHSSDIAVKPSNSYSIGKPFAIDLSKATEKDTWAVAKQDGEEGCKFEKLTDEQKKQMFTPPSANFPGGNGGGNGGGGGGGGGNEMSQLLDALKNMFGQGQGQNQNQPQTQSSPPPAGLDRGCPTTSYPACTKEGVTVCVPQTTDWRDLPNIQYDTVCTTEKSPATAEDFQEALNPEQQVQDMVGMVSQLANSGIPRAMIDGVISILITLIKNLFEGAAFPVAPVNI